jgi:hypothetical protein
MIRLAKKRRKDRADTCVSSIFLKVCYNSIRKQGKNLFLSLEPLSEMGLLI